MYQFTRIYPDQCFIYLFILISLLVIRILLHVIVTASIDKQQIANIVDSDETVQSEG